MAAIYEDAVGNLWIGTWNGGVDRFDPDAQAFRTLRPRPRTPDSLPAADVTAMHEAPDGALWLASRSGLLMTGDPRSGRFRTVATLPPKGGVFGLGWWQGRILVGMGGGLVVFDAISGREVPLDSAVQAFAERRIAAIRVVSDGAWLASGKDIIRVLPSAASSPWRVERLTLPIDGAVSAFSTVGSGRIWIGTDTAAVFRAEWRGDSGPNDDRAAPAQSGHARFIDRSPPHLIDPRGPSGKTLGWHAPRPRTGRPGLGQPLVAW